jgi:hypothetical protein
MRAVKTNWKQEAGIALLTTLLLLLLMSSLLVGFFLLINEGQKLGSMNNDYSKAFYAAEAGMEKLTADLGTLFDVNYSPTAGQLTALQTVPPVLTGITYVRADGTSGYRLEFTPDASGNPLATNATIQAGAYQGMTALSTKYTLTVTAHTLLGSEVKLRRSTQTVGIPMFQFGVFCDGDCDFFPGPVFNFGGRTHTNGNLFLASGNTLNMTDRVTAYKDVIRTNLANGWLTSTGYLGSVNITTGSGLRALGVAEGSLTGTVGSPVNPLWNNISLGATNYAGNLRNGATGAHKLDLGIVTLGAGATKPIDVIRRPVNTSESPLVTNERYFAQASLKVLLSDDPQDIMRLPCIDATTQPFNLAHIAVTPGVGGANWNLNGDSAALYAKMIANNLIAGRSTLPLPMATSGGLAAGNYNANDGYWIPGPHPIEPGYIKIEVQTAYANPCGAWRDVTIEVLGLGFAGRNIHPVAGVVFPTIPVLTDVNVDVPNLTTFSQVESNGVTNAVNPILPAGTGTPSGGNCFEPHPNAIIRLERIRDNPLTNPALGGCNVTNPTGAKVITVPTSPTDYWPNVLFDTREGTLRDFRPSTTVGIDQGLVPARGTIFYSRMVPLGGVMHYIEIDARNVGAYLRGAFGGNGPLAFDPNVAPNDFTVYVSDRRGNYKGTGTWAGNWPPVSPSLQETGEYGWNNHANPPNALTGCPNATLDPGEDADATGQLYLYGADPTRAFSAYNIASPSQGGYAPLNNVNNGIAASALTQNPFCPGAAIWPFSMVVNANEARENPNFFFRRAVKIMDGSVLNLGVCPGVVPCGLTVASENPVYIEGDFNANSVGGGWNDPHVATSIVADAVTLLSNNWNDYNSFYTPYDMNGVGALPFPAGSPQNAGQRGAVTSWYRVAIAAGKTIAFPQPAGTAQDFGTDGGIHNFLRYIETWGGQTLNYRGSIVNLFMAEQANSFYKCCTTVYSPPTRGYNFDIEFLQPQLLPPRTPLFRDINTTGFSQLLLPNQQ